MSETYVALIASFSGLFGALFGVIVSNLVTLRTSSKERLEANREARIRQLQDKIDALIELRAELQWEHAIVPPTQAQQVMYGKAYGILLSLPDLVLRENLATQIMNREFDEEGNLDQETRNGKINALNRAIMYLGDRVEEIRVAKLGSEIS